MMNQYRAESLGPVMPSAQIPMALLAVLWFAAKQAMQKLPAHPDMNRMIRDH
jgi:hypothetical protein